MKEDEPTITVTLRDAQKWYDVLNKSVALEMNQVDKVHDKKAAVKFLHHAIISVFLEAEGLKTAAYRNDAKARIYWAKAFGRET